jgi:2-amino-4-hydroxy-6-hydroxymethyldihydropteridine diphosphokinase
MAHVVLALGSNLGDRLGYVRGAVRAAFASIELSGLRWSPVYETEPVGGPAQDDYLNAVVVADTDIEPHAVLDLAQGWERGAGRERNVRWGPRTLDVDVVAVDGLRLSDERLTLPHPLAHERAFVLAPWHDLEPDAVLPGHGRVIDLLAGLHHAGVRRTALSLAPDGAEG